VSVLGEWRQAVILLRLFFFPWCRDTAVVLEEQTMASLMKMVVSLPLRFASSLFLLSLLFFLLLCFVSVSPLLLLVAAPMVAEWRCWMVVAEGHGGERGAAAGNPKRMILFSNFGPENPPSVSASL
jgi:hypothetical protein